MTSIKNVVRASCAVLLLFAAGCDVEAPTDPPTTATTTTAPPTATPNPPPTTRPPTRTIEPPDPEPTVTQEAARIPDEEDAPDIPYYKNCTAARAAGAAPLRRYEPGYRTALDRDRDGIACE